MSVVNENRILFCYNTSRKIQISGKQNFLTTERSGTNNNYDYKHSVIFDVLLQGVDWKVVSNVNCSKKETHSDYSREDFVINDNSDLFCTYIGGVTHLVLGKICH